MIDRYAVLGNPIAHSLSPAIHQVFAEQTDQAMSYEKFCVPVGDFKAFVTDYFKAGGKGVNVTVPFKEDAFHYADQVTERAKLAKAVNTLKRQDNGQIIGDNTDGEGLLQDLQQSQGWPIEQQRILIIGAGGAVRGILAPLLAAKPQQILIYNRTFAKSEQLAKDFAPLAELTELKAIESMPSFTMDMVINGSAAGLTGQVMQLSAEAISEHTYCYDMVYGQTTTPFMQWAQKKRACNVVDGLGMLVHQAAVAFALWRGVEPDVGPVLRQLRRVK